MLRAVYYGSNIKGKCPVGGDHFAQGYNFAPVHDIPYDNIEYGELPVKYAVFIR